MTREEAEKKVVDRVIEMQGCKATELAAQESLTIVFKEYSIWDLLYSLIAANKLVEVEYILPDIEYRIKSFLLPANTKAAVIKNGIHMKCVHE